MTGSPTSFKGEPRTEGPALCFVIRGEPDELLGESGGTELLHADFGLELAPETLSAIPVFALFSIDLTYIERREKH